jgi:phosphate:Na+ symporter
MFIIPDKGDEVPAKETLYIDNRILETPSIALNSAIRETIHMCHVVSESFEASQNAFYHTDEPSIKKTYRLEETINTLEKEITDYLVALSNKQIGEEERIIIDALFNNINDIERIGDHINNIAEIVELGIAKKISYSDLANDELADLYTRTKASLSFAFEAFETSKTEPAYKAISLEGEIDELEAICRKGHIQRLNSQTCTTEAGIIYLDIVANLERISDLSAKLAKVVVELSPIRA